jgi:hypothetical protein
MIIRIIVRIGKLHKDLKLSFFLQAHSQNLSYGY